MSKPKCPVLRDYCLHGEEAEELRAGIEKLITETSDSGWRITLQRLLDEVDARDSLAYLDAKADDRTAASPWRCTTKKRGSQHVTEFTVGVQHFVLARSDDPHEGRQHCRFMRDMFIGAMASIGAAPPKTRARKRSRA
ncbi:MAG: hypothetical protein HOW73_43365 [Polyangiaceae bacterium]|nr:hypothetical protein [Polyangiaceae bacterium]